MPTVFARLRRGLLPLLCCAMLQSPAAHAVTPQEFAALDPEDALRLPVLETLQVFGWRRDEFIFVLENALIDLRYLYRQPTGQPSRALTAAIRTFQREAGYPATGVLRVGEFMSLIQRGNEFWQAPIFPGPVQYSETEQSVAIEGTWVRQGGTEPDPIQSSSIRCSRAAGVCSAVTAKVMMSEGDSQWFHASAIDLALHAREWTVTQWTAERVEAEDRSSLCVVQHLVIDRAKQGAVLKSEPQADERCRSAAPAPLEYRLEGGYEVAARYWERRLKGAQTLRSKAFQQQVDRLSKKPRK